MNSGSHSRSEYRQAFRAYTIRPSRFPREIQMVRRNALLETLDNCVSSGAHVILASPFGSGKTSLAIQWAFMQGKPITLVTGHSISQYPYRWFSKPTEFGSALAHYMNALAVGPSEWGDIDAVIQQLHAAPADPYPHLLDGLAAIPAHISEVLIRGAAPVVEAGLTQQTIVLSRIIDADYMRILSKGTGVRSILADEMAMQDDEISGFRAKGWFSDISLDNSMAIRNQELGWIAGIQAASSGPKTLDAIVTNELLLRYPTDIQHAIMAIISAPYANHSLWRRLLRETTHDDNTAQFIMAAIPHTVVGDNDLTFQFPASLKASIRRVSVTLTNVRLMEQMQDVVLRWYMENNLHEPARELTHQLNWEHKLTAPTEDSSVLDQTSESPIKQEAIVGTLTKIRAEQVWELIRDNDNLNMWPKQLHVWEQMIEEWKRSDDPVWRARGELSSARRAWAFSRPLECLEAATIAQEIAPAGLDYEKFLAGALVAAAKSHLGADRESISWPGITSPGFELRADLVQIWHRAIRPLQLSYLSIFGMVREAQSDCIAEMESCSTYDPYAAARYALLLADLSLLRSDIHAASGYLEKARMLDSGISQDPESLFTECAISLARSDVRKAREIAERIRVSPNENPSAALRKTIIQARIRQMSGDALGAQVLLTNVGDLTCKWPKHPGEIPEGLLIALCQAATGAIDEGLTRAERVRTEANIRGHRIFEVAAVAIIAEILEIAGETARSSEAFERMLDIANSYGANSAPGILGLNATTRKDGVASGRSPQTPVRDSAAPRLTKRELSVLKLVSSGASNAAIADQLYMSINTVKSHLASISIKLKTKNRTAAVAIAKKNGLLDDIEPE